MIRNILNGAVIGIVNLIPGVSGGTMMVMLGILDQTTDSISHLFKKGNFKYVITLFLGVLIGLFGFSSIIKYLIDNFPTETIFWFIGMIIVSVPFLRKKELPDQKLKVVPFIIGLLIIFALGYFNQNATLETIISFPEVTLIYLLEMVLVGFISGAATIFPGISGSMLLLVLGYYSLYNAYLSNAKYAIKLANFEFFIPIAFIGIGIGLGIFFSSKLTSYLLKKHKSNTMSLIIGLVVASALILLPVSFSTTNIVSFNADYDLISILTYIGAFIFGGGLVFLFEKISLKRKEKEA